MSLESLGGYFKNSRGVGLSRVYIAEKIRKIVEEKTGLNTTIIITDKTIKLLAESNAEAELLRYKISTYQADIFKLVQGKRILVAIKKFRG